MKLQSLLALLALTAGVVASCGSSDDAAGDPAPEVSDADDAADTETGSDDIGSDDTGADGTGSDTENTDAEDEGATADSRVAIDASALPSDPAGYEQLTADLCSIYDADQLDAFFLGAGELATEENLGDSCRWSIDADVRSHSVMLRLMDDIDTPFVEQKEITVADSTMTAWRGPDEYQLFVPTPDGRYLLVVIHGPYGGPGGAWQNRIDFVEPAAEALADNLVSRF